MGFQVTLRGARVLALGLLWLALVADQARGQTPYYQGKTITIVRGGEPGGTGDLQARALIPFLEKYLPGRQAYDFVVAVAVMLHLAAAFSVVRSDDRHQMTHPRQ